MRPSLAIASSLLATLPLLAALPAAAQSAAPVCSKLRPVPPQLMEHVPGVYDLSNGDILRVSKDARRFFADMKTTGHVEIIPLSEHLFAEKGGPVRFEFNRDWPDVDVLISGLEQPRPRGQVCPSG